MTYKHMHYIIITCLQLPVNVTITYISLITKSEIDKIQMYVSHQILIATADLTAPKVQSKHKTLSDLQCFSEFF